MTYRDRPALRGVAHVQPRTDWSWLRKLSASQERSNLEPGTWNQEPGTRNLEPGYASPCFRIRT